MKLFTLLAALFLQTLPVRAQESEPGSRVGDMYEIRWESEAEWSENSEFGSSGNSHSQNAYVERIISLSEAGVVLEFDLPPDTSEEDRARTWQVPVRVLRPPSGPLRLLNGTELEARVTRWLARAGWPREVCGRWMFTWTEIKIECDPQSVVETIIAVDLGSVELRDGATYRDPMGLAPMILRREAGSGGSAALVAEGAINPEMLRRQQAEADAALSDIMGDRAELRAFREARAPKQISGTVRIRFENEAAAGTLRRTRVIRLETERMDGSRENRTVTETVERRLVTRTR